MQTIKTLALNSFKETIRDRILYLILFVGVILIAASTVLASISLDQDKKILLDFGLSAILIFGAIVAFFLGATSIDKEFDKKIIYLIFPKPISKTQFIVGRFFGQALTLLVAILILTIIFLALVFFKIHTIGWFLLPAIGFTYLELLLLSALTLMLAVLSRPLNALIYALILFFLGHSLNLILNLANQSSSFVSQWVLKAVYYVLPNLSKFDWRLIAVNHLPVSASQILISIAYFIVYTSLLLLLAVKILEKKEY